MSWIQQHFWKEYHTNLADEVSRMAYGGDVFNDITALTVRSLVSRPSMGIFSHGYSQDTLLTNEGMADHLWDMFLSQ